MHTRQVFDPCLFDPAAGNRHGARLTSPKKVTPAKRNVWTYSQVNLPKR